MEIIAATEGSPIADAVDAAADALDDGDIVAIPTDTVYGLIADVSSSGAGDRLFALKLRSREDDLSVLVSDIAQAMAITIAVPDAAERLMSKFWPGPLTIVLPRHPEFNADLGNDDLTVGLRCVDNVVARLICEEVGPIAVTTANVEGSQPATTAQEVVDAFGKEVEIILDGGICAGPHATVVDCTGADPKLLREGAIAWSDIQAAFN